MDLLRNITLLFCLFWSSQVFPQLSSDDKREKAMEDVGDVLQIALPAVAGMSTIYLKDKKGFWQFTKSFGSAVAITYILKYTINKPRPEQATDGHAFPSGHTTVAFSGASFIQRRYGWAYGAPAYGLAAFVAYSRLEGQNDRHDVWDVLGGAAVGIGTTYLFTTPYQKEHYELTFSSGNDIYLIGFKIKF